MPDQMIEVLHDIASKINKSQRELFPVIYRLGYRNSLVGDELHRDARKWLSPPDPWENHSTARESHHKGTSTWFVQGDTFIKWKSSGPDPLLWVHGKRKCLNPTPYY
jgi:hypothetical protein